ncbi:alpha/beta hydrolase family protein [Toxoplasma gondii RUB]|uniref:Alpha/beta hydrolase family protein n=1 Tax=Toxoplasma gondii RUB TaxID=935652 RepID=A0A086M6V9_TOXGO|nr:alpha/beta hydrolase family protein [Toxoplasma gondii RUB]
MLDIGGNKLSCLSCVLSVLPPAKRKLVAKVAFSPSPLPGYVVEERRIGGQVRHACFLRQGGYRELPFAESFPCPKCAQCRATPRSRARGLSGERRTSQRKESLRSQSVPPREREREDLQTTEQVRVAGGESSGKEGAERVRCERTRLAHLLPPADRTAFLGDASDRQVTKAAHHSALQAADFDEVPGVACVLPTHMSRLEECHFPEFSSRGTGSTPIRPSKATSSGSFSRNIEATKRIPSIVVTGPQAENNPFGVDSSRNSSSIDDVFPQLAVPQFSCSPSPAAALEFEGRSSGGRTSFVDAAEASHPRKVGVFGCSCDGGRVSICVESVRLVTDENHVIWGFYYAYPHAKWTVLYSHGNGTDIGHLHESVMDLCRRLQVNVLSYDYSGYGCTQRASNLDKQLKKQARREKQLREKKNSSQKRTVSSAAGLAPEKHATNAPVARRDMSVFSKNQREGNLQGESVANAIRLPGLLGPKCDTECPCGDEVSKTAGDCPLKWYREDGGSLASLASSLKPSERSVYADVMAAFRWLRTEKNVKLRDLVLYGQSIGSVPAVHLASVLGRERRAALARLEKKEKAAEATRRKKEKKEQKRKEKEMQERVKRVQSRVQATQGGPLPSRFSRLVSRRPPQRVRLLESDESTAEIDDDIHFDTDEELEEERCNEGGRDESDEGVEMIGGIILHSALASGLSVVRSRLKKTVLSGEASTSGVYETSTAPTTGSPSSLASSSSRSTAPVYSLMLAEDRLDGDASVEGDQETCTEKKGLLRTKTPWYDVLRNVDKMKHIAAPVFVLHGTEDTVVPIASGERLAASAAVPFPLFAAKGAGHNNVDKGEWKEEYFARLRDFFDFLALHEMRTDASGEELLKQRLANGSGKSGGRATVLPVSPSAAVKKSVGRQSETTETRESGKGGSLIGTTAAKADRNACALPSRGSFSTGLPDRWICPQFSTVKTAAEPSPAHPHLPTFADPSGGVYGPERAHFSFREAKKSRDGKAKTGGLRSLFSGKLGAKV